MNAFFIFWWISPLFVSTDVVLLSPLGFSVNSTRMRMATVTRPLLHLHTRRSIDNTAHSIRLKSAVVETFAY
ncbi:hypothetical protein QBC39DRAFT_107950 [Podospora conica]|nr:hypothetical protein QBC39DRAFT_107950 [Schizothecium conicum]